MSLSGQLPKGERNGLGPIMRALISQPRDIHVVIALVDNKTTKINWDDEDPQPTIRIRRIEVVHASDLARAQDMIDRAYTARSGQTPLPFELQEEVDSAFARVDLSTGEILHFPDPPGADDDDGDES